MVHTCLICKKRSDKSQDLSFHRFPSNFIIRQQWLDIVGNLKGVPGRNTFVCSSHFESECFRYGLVNGKKFLKPESKPTLNLGTETSSLQTHNNNLQQPNIQTYQTEMQPSISELVISKKRRQETPLAEVISTKKIRLTDITWEELSKSLTEGKIVWETICEELLHHEKKIECLQHKVRRMKQKILTFKSFTKDLLKKNLLTENEQNFCT